MPYMRIGVYQFQPDALDEVIKRAAEGMLPVLRQQPGFISYAIVKTGEGTGISLSTWATEEQANAAVGTIASWVQGNIAPMVASLQNHVGEVVLSSWDGA